jgi:hypothetical protein
MSGGKGGEFWLFRYFGISVWFQKSFVFCGCWKSPEFFYFSGWLVICFWKKMFVALFWLFVGSVLFIWCFCVARSLFWVFLIAFDCKNVVLLSLGVFLLFLSLFCWFFSLWLCVCWVWLIFWMCCCCWKSTCVQCFYVVFHVEFDYLVRFWVVWVGFVYFSLEMEREM